MTNTYAQAVIEAAKQLSDTLSQLSFSEPVANTYNPLEYAWSGHEAYIKRFVKGPIDCLYLGMNPGPFGMAQTGVPFGEIAAVSDWMGINCLISAPAQTHPKRPILGFGCGRSEVSGRRLWGLMADIYGSAEAFFESNYVANFCPLLWMSDSGANLTPVKLGKEQTAAVDIACQQHLVRLIDILQPRCLIGVGGYALKQLALADKSSDTPHILASILHPSPASPMANKQWPEKPRAQIAAIMQQLCESETQGHQSSPLST